MLVKAGSRTNALTCKLLQHLINATRDNIAMQCQRNQRQMVPHNQQQMMQLYTLIACRFNAFVQSTRRLAGYGCGWVRTSISPKVCLPLHHAATQQMSSNSHEIQHVSMQQSTTHASCCNTSSMQPAAMLHRIVSITSGSHCGANSSK